MDRQITKVILSLVATSLILCKSATAFQAAFSSFGTSFAKPAFGRTASVAASAASSVSVCTADLCCCQEEGLGGSDILNDLRSRNLPYPIEDAPCLGACGGGAMVAIDFEDGSYALVTGIEETLTELGLAQFTKEDSPVSVTNEPADSVTNEEIDVKGSSSDTPDVEPIISANDEIVVTTITEEIVETTTTENRVATSIINEVEKPLVDVKVDLPPPTATETFGDVRDRMRAEVAQDEQQINPWFNAASYLAKKARGKLFSKE